MKKFFAIAVMLFASMASVSAQDALGLTDDAEMIRIQNKHFVDQYRFKVAGADKSYTAASLVTDDAYLGATAGMMSFDGHFVPYVGAVLGWEGGPKHPYMFEVSGTFNRGNYTSEASRTNDYCEFDGRAIAALRVYTSPNKRWRAHVGAYMDYKLNFDAHDKDESQRVIEKTDNATIIYDNVGDSGSEVKGSTSGFGEYNDLGFHPEMKPYSIHLYCGVGAQQRYYNTGNRWHLQVFAGVKFCINLTARTVWNKSLMKATGMSKKEVKKAVKSHSTKTVNWHAN